MPPKLLHLRQSYLNYHFGHHLLALLIPPQSPQNNREFQQQQHAVMALPPPQYGNQSYGNNAVKALGRVAPTLIPSSQHPVVSGQVILEYNPRSGNCTNCGVESHKAMDCPTPERKLATSNRKILPDLLFLHQSPQYRPAFNANSAVVVYQQLNKQ